MGGRPGQALYFVGLQNYELIFLDPHLVQEAVTYEEDEWIDCEMSKDDFAEFQAQSMKAKNTKGLKRKFRKSMGMLKKKKDNSSERERGPKFPKVKIRDTDR